jgi:hypothetical protein
MLENSLNLFKTRENWLKLVLWLFWVEKVTIDNFMGEIMLHQ